MTSESASTRLERGRYLRENGQVVVDVAVRSSRQLFNERDPAPFLERDLDDDFAAYVLSSVEEFPLGTPMRLRISIQEEAEGALEQKTLREAIRSYFTYEAKLMGGKRRKRLRIGRWFFLVGVVALSVCLGIAQLLSALEQRSRVWGIAREGFVIIGWVGMWRPVEVFLYDWWPLREQERYLMKVAGMDIDVRCMGSRGAASTPAAI